MTFGSPLGNAASMLVSDRFGRKSSLVVCTLAAAVLGILYSMAATATAVVLVGFLLVFFMGLMIGVGWAVYVPELFPTELRMRGAGICNTAGRIVSIFMPYAVVALFEGWGVSGVVLTLSAILLATAAAILLLGIETRRRSLEDLRPDEDQLLLSGAVAKGPGA
jgi:putative MFS transporter